VHQSVNKNFDSIKMHGKTVQKKKKLFTLFHNRYKNVYIFTVTLSV
jgi:hypothetical protein